MKRSRTTGFTLLEVMVAIGILGMALTAIFSSQVGAVKAGFRAERTSVAALLARCKMGEVEEHVLAKGMPAVDAKGSDECCEGAEFEGFSCDWRIERVVLPDVGGGGLDLAGAGDAKGGPPGIGEGASENPAKGAEDAKKDPQSMVQNLLGGGAGGGGDAIGSVAITYAYPIIKPTIEEQVRRATVTVKWLEGSRERSFDVVQFLVADTVPSARDLVNPQMPPGMQTPGAPTTPTPTPATPGIR